MYEIPSLTYKYADLEPFIDETTMRVHHTKHHQAYTDKLNVALGEQPDLFVKDLATLIRQAEKLLPENIRATVINNGGGFLNHSFWWNILGKPDEKNKDNKPDGTTIGVMIEDQYGNYEEFRKQFKEKALSLFGSGWTWLSISELGNLEIINTTNQNILPENKQAIIAVDLWEHAYYLKYQNRRTEYLDAFFHVVDWNKVDKLMKEKDSKQTVAK